MKKISFDECPAHGRATVLKKALAHVHLLDKQELILLETGCIRNVDWKYSDGHSTLLFGWYCQKYNGTLYTLEINREALELCKKLTKEYKDSIRYILGDSSDTILKLGLERIDLLYLDSANDASIALNEYNAAKHFLHSESIIIVDDVVSGNKGMLVGPQMTLDGWNIELIENNEGGGGGSYYCTKNL
jgi:hypothetical protein